ncbi:hypothetical protein [Arthrobacter pascens]|uniref:hypothetical protein n=1 Tax=Arthrobacter pascens TaxID=1677 RepID=UPI0027D81079|nr:hypothetical protein [Arthrobacter pascens]
MSSAASSSSCGAVGRAAVGEGAGEADIGVGDGDDVGVVGVDVDFAACFVVGAVVGAVVGVGDGAVVAVDDVGGVDEVDGD